MIKRQTSPLMHNAPSFGRTDLLSRLPEVQGKYRPCAVLADMCWFGVGGAAEVLFTPANADDLAHFLNATPPDIPVNILGAGSNILVRDGGVSGVVIKLGRDFGNIEFDDAHVLTAGAAAQDMMVARAAAKHGLAGVEFFAGIPGTIGGALAMNAGAYGCQTADCFISAEGFDRQGKALHLSKNDMSFAYRQNGLGEDVFFTSACFALQPGNADDIARRMAEITNARQNTQPVKTRTGGSTFRNPDGTKPDGVKAWQLIDKAGCRGLRQGGAQISEQHCNFMVNDGTATASDLEMLGETVREKVMAETGIALDWEIKRIGQFLVEGEGA